MQRIPDFQCFQFFLCIVAFALNGRDDDDPAQQQLLSAVKIAPPTPTSLHNFWLANKDSVGRNGGDLLVTMMIG